MGRKIVLMHSDCSPEQVIQHAGKKGMKWDMQKHYEKYPEKRTNAQGQKDVESAATRGSMLSSLMTEVQREGKVRRARGVKENLSGPKRAQEAEERRENARKRNLLKSRRNRTDNTGKGSSEYQQELAFNSQKNRY